MSTGAKVGIGIAIGISGFLVIAVLAAIAIPVYLNQRAKAESGRIADASGLTTAQLAAAPYCGVAPTPDMPADTKAYVDALIVSNRDRAAFSQTVGAAGGRASTQDLESFLATDAAFVRSITAIPWSSPTRKAQATSAVAAIQNYDQALAAAIPGQGTGGYDPASVQSALTTRLASTQALRAGLRLPDNTCAFIWPR